MSDTNPVLSDPKEAERLDLLDYAGGLENTIKTLRGDVDNLLWNLGGVSSVCMGALDDDFAFDESAARAALHDAVKLRRGFLAQRDHIATLEAEVGRITAENQRLRDLVRTKRWAFHEEYATLAGDHGAVTRLEGYDLMRRERDEARRMLGECYVLSGADTDGNDWPHLWPHAVRAVAELRADYDEECACSCYLEK